MIPRILVNAIKEETTLLPGALLLAWNLARDQQRTLGLLVDVPLMPALLAELHHEFSPLLLEQGHCQIDGVSVVELSHHPNCEQFDGVALFVGDEAISSTLADNLPLASGIVLVSQSSSTRQALTVKWPNSFLATLKPAAPELSQTQQEGVDWFDANYDLRASGHLDPKGPVQKLGEGEPQTCRYCQRSAPDVTFSNISHALPEQIGNKKLIDLRECDCCNKHFSALEDSFGKWTLPIRNLGRVKGKANRIPKYRSADQKMRIDSKEGHMSLSAQIGDDRAELDAEGKQLRLSMERQPYIPMATYKTFVKMALAIMPGDVSERFKAYSRWVLEENHSDGPLMPLTVFTQFIPGPIPSDKVTYLLLERKAGTDSCPSIIFVVQFSNYTHQIVLALPPQDEAPEKVNLSFRYFPTPGDGPERTTRYGPVRRWRDDLSSTEVCKGDIVSISLAFDKVSKVPLDGDAEVLGDTA